MKNIRKESIKYRKKNKQGLTLIALVVTIVILLILAGVTINAVLRDNGIFKTAKEATNKFNEAQQEEAEGVANLEDQMGNLINGSIGDVTPEEPEKPEESEKWDGTSNDKVIAVPSEDATPVNVPVPIGFTASTIREERTVEGGFVIKQGNDGSLTTGVNEFVWIPANVENMYEELTDPITLSGGVTTKTSIYSKLRGIEANIPGSTGYREPDLLGSSDTNKTYQTNLGVANTQDMADKMIAEYMEIHDSIKKYGGFYIGRYELTGTIGSPTVQKGKAVIVQQNWYNLKKACINVVNNTGKEEKQIIAKTTMIYGNQWDEVMDWLSDKYNVNSSSTWGNFSGTRRTAGYSNTWKANNIYDLAGNVWEWTQEATSSNIRIGRGGKYNSSTSQRQAVYRHSISSSASSYSTVGSRCILYIHLN